MFLSWHGQSCFSLTSKKISFVLDPYDEAKVGLKLPDLNVDVITFSFQQNDLKTNDSIKVFDWPGEYEVANIPFMGVYSRHPKTDRETLIFKFGINGINICHLDTLDHVPESQVIDRIGKIDLLMSPVGGDGDFGTKQINEVIEELEPSVLVPMVYKTPGLKMDAPELSSFLKELGIKEHRTEDRLDIEKTSYPAGHLDVIELQPIFGK